MTDGDVEEIVSKLGEAHINHNCRFGSISPADMMQVVKFNQNFEKMLSKTGSIIWATVLVAVIGGAISMFFIGFISKITGKIP